MSAPDIATLIQDAVSRAVTGALVQREGVVTDGHEAGGQLDRRQRRAALEGAVTDAREAAEGSTREKACLHQNKDSQK